MTYLKALLILMAFTFLPVQAQVDNSPDLGIFNKCEITYTDGHTISGYIAFFLEISPKDSEDIYITSVERVLNLDDNNFDFKASLTDVAKSLSQKDIKSIKVNYNNNITTTYRLMDIRKLSENGTLSTTSSKKAWLPVIKDDVISLYQKNIYSAKSRYVIKENDFDPKKTKKLVTITYLSNEKQNVAFEIYNIDKRRILKRNLNDAYLAKVLKYIFKDCPKFLDKIIKNDKWGYEPYTEADDTYNDEIKEVKNSNLDDFEKFRKIDELDLRKEAQPFIRLIEEYKSNCN